MRVIAVPFLERFRIGEWDGGNWLIAGLLGVGLLVQPVLLSPLMADVLQSQVNWPIWSFLQCVALSHVAYALFGRDFN